MKPPVFHLTGERGRPAGPRPGPQLRAARQRQRDGAGPDPAVARVREAGGPDDRACYTCPCGLLFVERVSTTVRCPHCGAEQAW